MLWALMFISEKQLKVWYLGLTPERSVVGVRSFESPGAYKRIFLTVQCFNLDETVIAEVIHSSLNSGLI